MSLSEVQKKAWSLMEDAVIYDRECDEERCLLRVIQSYLSRRGMSETLSALNEDLDSIQRARGEPLRPPSICPVAPSVIDEARQRKRAQLLCLQGRMTEAAALLPEDSVLRVKLLCVDALEISERTTALQFLTQAVAPLISRSTDPIVSHTLYISAIAALVTAENPRTLRTSPAQRKQLAIEVNEALQPDAAPSSLNVMLAWLNYQHSLSDDSGRAANDGAVP